MGDEVESCDIYQDKETEESGNEGMSVALKEMSLSIWWGCLLVC